MKILSLSGLLLISLLAGCSDNTSRDIGDQVKPAQKLLADGDYAGAYDEYHRIATKLDNPLAMFTIALFYDNGWDRDIDHVEACRWYEKAAHGDIPAATESTGRCYEQGIHQEADPAAAAIWYQKAADLGLHYALCHLGDLYIKGHGVEKDADKGLALCKRSAEQGSVPAMMRLARYYRYDTELKNDEAAINWYTAAASYRNATAQYELGVMLRDGIGISKDPRVALEWFEHAAAQGHRPAYFQTASLYFDSPIDAETGLWSEQDLAKTYMWLTASKRASDEPEEREQAAAMLEKVLQVMPPTWVADLDVRVDEHLAKFAASGTE